MRGSLQGAEPFFRGDGALLAFLFLLSFLPAATVQGTVRAEGSREPIAHATVQIPALGRGVLTDARGYFVVTDVPEGRWRVRTSALGYRPHEVVVQVPASGAVRLDFELTAQPVEIAGVEVHGAPRRGGPGDRSAAPDAGPAPLRIDPATVGGMPALAESDVLRALQMLPSVQAISDFSSALYVRGGSADQNLMLLDGVPLFNPYHLGGIFGSIDPDAVATVEVMPGAFPARVGDRLASVIEVHTRDGGRDRIRGSGAVGLVSSRAGLDGPLPGGRGSFLVSGRRTYLDLFTDAAYRLGMIEVTVPYAFTDAHLKLTHDVGELGRLSASFYINEEGLDVPNHMRTHHDEKVDFTWGSRVAALRYWQPLGATLIGELRAAVSTFHGSFDARWEDDVSYTDADGSLVTREEERVEAYTGVRDLLAAADLTWYRGPHRVRSGVQLDAYLFDYNMIQLGELSSRQFPPFQRTDRPTTLAAYLEDAWSVSERFDMRAGMRVLHAGERGTELLPRFGARYALSRSLALSVGAGRSAQVMHSMKNDESLFGSVIAYDLLTAVPREAGFSTAEDVVGGIEWASGTTSVRLDAYAKRMSGLPLPPLTRDLLDAPAIVATGLRIGTGTGRGIELLAQHTRGRAFYSLAYALSEAQRTAEGASFAPRFERRHTLDALSTLPLGRSGQLGTRLTLGTGQPYTPVIGIGERYDYDPVTKTFGRGGLGGPYIVLGEHNSGRLPGYLRMDVAARRSYQRRWFGRATTLTPYLQVVNVLNTKNVMAAFPELYGSQGPQLQYAPQLPLFPTLGFEWKF